MRSGQNVSTVRISRAEATIPGETINQYGVLRIGEKYIGNLGSWKCPNRKGLIREKIGSKAHLIEGEE